MITLEKAKIYSALPLVVKQLKNMLVMVKDTARIGISYLDVTPNKNKITKHKVSTAVKNRTASHIFVLADDSRFEKLKEEYSQRSDAILNEYFDYIKKYADKQIYTEPQKYVLGTEERNLLQAVRTILERIIALSFMWRVTGDKVYAERCRLEMLNACAFKDWFHWHFLDTAEMSFAIALGTNWMYDYLSEDDVNTFFESVKSKAFDKTKSKNFSINWWKWSKNNWNSVCYGGIATAAMVFYDRCEDFASEFLAASYNKMTYNFETFTPDGVYVEGGDYWGYCTTYLAYFISTSENFIGTDFGLSATPGFLELGMFPLYINGATGIFNYGDSWKGSISAPSLYWFSKKTGKPEIAYYQAATVSEKLKSGYTELKECVNSALWYESSLVKGYNPSNYKAAVYLKSDASQELAIFRSGMFDQNATFAAIKGGYNYTSHGDLDIGSFVFDSQGVRWAEDLGSSDYGIKGYFVGICGGGRWKVYAKRAEGHNTLVFNSKSVFEDQYPFAKATISKFKETPDGGVAVLDITDAYKFNKVKKSIREFELYHNRSSLRIKDTFTCIYPTDVFWFMHTKSDIELIDEHNAIMTFGDKKMSATLSDESVGRFEVLEAKSMKRNINHLMKGDWNGLKKLAVHADNVKNGIIDVRLEPVK